MSSIHISRRAALLSALGLAAVTRARGQPSSPMPPTVEELYRDPVTRDVALSPDSDRIAVLKSLKGSGSDIRPRTVVEIFPAGDLKAKPVTVSVGPFAAYQVEWVTDERLLIWVQMTHDVAGYEFGIRRGKSFFPMPQYRLLAINSDGTDALVVLQPSGAWDFADFDLARVVDYLPDDPDHILMQRYGPAPNTTCLVKVSVRNGMSTVVESSGLQTVEWFTQNGVAVLRVDANRRRTNYSVFARAPGAKAWTLVRESRRNDNSRYESFDLVGASEVMGELLVSHRPPDAEFKSIHRFDLSTLKMGSAVVEAVDRDLTRIFQDENRVLIGAGYVDDVQRYRGLPARIERRIDALRDRFGLDANIRLYDIDQPRRRALLNVSSPRLAGFFACLDLETGQFDILGEQRPWLAGRLAPTEALTIAARDGQSLRAYLTRPRGQGPFPLIVMPHGGPEARDQLDYSPWLQSFAAQGWMVLQVNFRGSSGYGRRFTEAGYGQWGGLMQQDVDDSVVQILASQAIDRERVAICGASYGAYAAMLGLVQNPDIYRCGVAIAGDFDLRKTLEFSRREDGAQSVAYNYWLKSIGDPQRDRDKLREVSPRHRIDEIRAPVLMIHGVEDEVVSIEQSRDMAKALARAGKPHQFVELPGFGHNDWDRETNERVLGMVVNFVFEHFGGRKPTSDQPTRHRPTDPAGAA